MNLEIFEFKENLIHEINKSTLPIMVKQMALQDILKQVDTAVSIALNNERVEKEKAGEEDGQSI